jgi:hypothetical protein
MAEKVPADFNPLLTVFLTTVMPGNGMIVAV